MSKQNRQARYKSRGAASDLVKVEVLVPPAARSRVLDLGAQLRSEYRQKKDLVQGIQSRVRAACAYQPRRFTGVADIDPIVITSVNVPFHKRIDAKTLADAIAANTVPIDYAPHLERFFGEEPLINVLRFCDKHQIKPDALALFVRTNAATLAVRRPELENHLNALVPNP